jgi:hypothetical protein
MHAHCIVHHIFCSDIWGNNIKRWSLLVPLQYTRTMLELKLTKSWDSQSSLHLGHTKHQLYVTEWNLDMKSEPPVHQNPLVFVHVSSPKNPSTTWKHHQLRTMFAVFNWQNIQVVEITGGLLWTQWWTFGFLKMLGSSWVAAQLAASQKGLSSVSKLVSK